MAIRELSDNGEVPIARGDDITKSYFEEITRNLLKKLA
jgi:hypothetical protein